jgi:hypothetical protein
MNHIRSMSLYVHDQNKKLLWKTIQSSPFFMESDVNWSWFETIMQKFVNKYPYEINATELKQLNRETIAYMFKEMKEQVDKKKEMSYKYHHQAPEVRKHQHKSIQEAFSLEPIYTRNDTVRREEEFNSSVSKLQKEMMESLRKDVPPEVNFSMDMKDEPIQNIEQLLEQQRREREIEYQIFEQPQPTPDFDVSSNKEPSTVRSTTFDSQTPLSVQFHDRDPPANLLLKFGDDIPKCLGEGEEEGEEGEEVDDHICNPTSELGLHTIHRSSVVLSNDVSMKQLSDRLDTFESNFFQRFDKLLNILESFRPKNNCLNTDNDSSNLGDSSPPPTDFSNNCLNSDNDSSNLGDSSPPPTDFSNNCLNSDNDSSNLGDSSPPPTDFSNNCLNESDNEDVY